MYKAHHKPFCYPHPKGSKGNSWLEFLSTSLETWMENVNVQMLNVKGVDAGLWGLHGRHDGSTGIRTDRKTWTCSPSRGQVNACRQEQEVSPGRAPRPRSPEHTGKWCDRWRTCQIQRCCRSPSWSIPLGSGGRTTIQKA